MNRVAAVVEVVREKFAELPPEDVAKTDEAMAVTFEEHFDYQQMQARAHAMGKLSVDEAQVVYVALGEVGSDANGGWAEGTDTATKYAVTMLMAKLVKDMIENVR